jgi:hypothetical protein
MAQRRALFDPVFRARAIGRHPTFRRHPIVLRLVFADEIVYNETRIGWRLYSSGGNGRGSRMESCADLSKSEVEIMKRPTVFAACLGVLTMISTAQARTTRGWVGATYVPLDRVIPNMETFIKEHPNDPQGYYSLARLHYFVFVDQSALVPMMSVDSAPPTVAADWQRDQSLSAIRYAQAQQLVLKAWGYTTTSDVPANRQAEFQGAVSEKKTELDAQEWKPDGLDTGQVLTHAATAVDNFERALDLDPENGLYYLGLASFYDQYAFYTANANITDHPRQLACITTPKIRVLYYLAYRFSIEDDREATSRPTGDLRALVSYEAGTAYLRLVEKEPAITDANSIAAIKADLAQLEMLGISVTPIIFSTHEHASVQDLLDPNTHTTFDLNGTGRKAQWPWIKPTTGLLVWDPLNKGEITSGRQLFGTATWWLLFPNGYAALDALDDNRDGSLSGSELRGIGVWFDKNSNGRSDPGEVQPATDFGVQAIRTRSTGSDHGMLMNTQGIVLKNGAIVPTYDWIVSPER